MTQQAYVRYKGFEVWVSPLNDFWPKQTKDHPALAEASRYIEEHPDLPVLQRIEIHAQYCLLVARDDQQVPSIILHWRAPF